MARYHNHCRRSHASFGIVLLLALSVTACGVGGVSLDSSEYSKIASADPLVTGTVVDDGVTDVDPQDWKTVQDAISTSFSTLEDGGTTQWNNESTGSNGSIVPEPIITNAQGEICRPFQTTLDTISGVENFDGYACKQRNGSWRITKVAPTESESETEAQMPAKLPAAS